MTQAQERRVEMIRRDIEKEFFPMHRNPEVKEFRVEELECGIVSLIAEVGGVNDSGTYASIYCRERIHVFIGRKGAITYYPYSIKNCNAKRLGRRSLYNVYYEQDVEESERRKLSQQRRRKNEKEAKESTNE